MLSGALEDRAAPLPQQPPSTARHYGMAKEAAAWINGTQACMLYFRKEKNYSDNFEKAIDLPVYFQRRQHQRAERAPLKSFLWLVALGTVAGQRCHSAEIIHFIISGTQKGNYAGQSADISRVTCATGSIKSSQQETSLDTQPSLCRGAQFACLSVTV